MVTRGLELKPTRESNVSQLVDSFKHKNGYQALKSLFRLGFFPEDRKRNRWGRLNKENM